MAESQSDIESVSGHSNGSGVSFGHGSPNHESEVDCQEEKKANHHYITAKRASAPISQIVTKLTTRRIAASSPIITVLVGENQVPFQVYKDVLTLHSAHYRRELEEEELSETHLDNEVATPSAFACFLAWMLTAETDEGVANSSDSFGDMFEGLWFLREWLECPDFQNYCMNRIRLKAKDSSGAWPDFSVVRWVCEMCARIEYEDESNEIRKLVVDSLAFHCRNSGSCWGGSQRKEWRELLEEDTDGALAVDVCCVSGEIFDVDGVILPPYEDHRKEEYMVKGESLAQRWKDQILESRTRDEIKMEAEDGCLRSSIEHEFLVDFETDSESMATD